MDALVFTDPWRKSVTPGGASTEVLKSYAFVMFHVIYPTAGCWELTVQLGEHQVRIVRELN